MIGGGERRERGREGMKERGREDRERRLGREEYKMIKERKTEISICLRFLTRNLYL